MNYIISLSILVIISAYAYFSNMGLSVIGLPIIRAAISIMLITGLWPAIKIFSKAIGFLIVVTAVVYALAMFTLNLPMKEGLKWVMCLLQ